MKYYGLISAMIVLALAGCSGLSDEDRALITDTRSMAQESQIQSTRAAQDAAAARQSAESAALEAARASEKADRIFQHSTDK